MNKKYILIIVGILFTLIFISLLHPIDADQSEQEYRYSIEEIDAILRTTTNIHVCKYMTRDSDCDQNGYIKNITSSEEINEYIHLITDATIWDGYTSVTLQGVQYKLVMYDINNLKIGVLIFNPGMDLNIGNHHYLLKNSNEDLLLQLIEQ